MENHYTVLGLTKESTVDEIKKRYRELAMLHHPDKGGNEDMFKKIVNAYSVLSDNAKKTDYDTKIKSSSPFSGKRYQAEKPNTTTTTTKKASNWEEFKKKANNKYDNYDEFSDWYATSSENNKWAKENNYTYKKEENTDIHIHHTILFKDFVVNTSGPFTFGRKTICGCNQAGKTGFVVCQSCNGSGTINKKATCILCNGTGKVNYGSCGICNGKIEYWETVTTEVPVSLYRNILYSGSEHKIVLDNMGNQSRYGGRRGKLYLSLSLVMDNRFTIQGNDVVYTKKMKFTELFETDGIEFEWMGENIRIPSDDVIDYIGMPIRIKYKGMRESGMFERGDLIVSINMDLNISTLLKNDNVKKVMLEEYSKLKK